MGKGDGMIENMSERKKGDRYRPIVAIKKVKKGVPTVITVSGHTYRLQHPDHMRDAK
jgi:hypothetical protein